MIKISGMMDKANTYKSLVVVIFRSFLFQELPQTKQFLKFFSVRIDKIREKIKV